MPSPFDAILLPPALRLSCGAEIRRVTVWHGFLLEAVQSPYLVGGSASREDFTLAALVLSSPPGDVARTLKKAKRRAAGMVEWYARRPDKLKADAAALSALMADVLKGYRVKQSRDGDKGPETPFCYSLAVILRTAFGMGYEEAMGWPLKQAILDVQTLRELEGARRIISESAARLLDKVAAARNGGGK